MLNEKYFKELFKKEWKLYYRTPELNEKLYLHYKGMLIVKDYTLLGGQLFIKLYRIH